jgi:malonate-semialdehyde dehydrogenase (acetylating) / methylmalonate-semialdehyde dehydrogenase
MRELTHFVAGRATAGEASGRSTHIHNPATGAVSARVPLAGAHESHAAVGAAAEAFPAWAATPPLQRARVLFRFKHLIEQNLDELARLVSSEHGKLVSDARGSVIRGLEVVEFACGIPHLLKGDFTENVSTNVDSHSLRQPLGVCVGITPFNFPAMVPMWMFPVAVACGNTFILKPSEKDPSTAVRLAELFHEAGAPDGVLNVLHGDRETVETLLTDPRVAAVSFVGSTPVAKSIYEIAAREGKRVQALGGAKNHAVVMPDADLDQAVEAIVGAAYGSAGERCMAISACVVVGDAGDAFVERLRTRVTNLRIGFGDDSKAEMGPVISAEHRARIVEYIAIGESEGARLLVDGRGYRHQDQPEGFFLGGTLLDHVTASMRVWREEIFGPVLCVLRAADFAQALDIVNSHEYGNGAAIFTRSGGVARAFSHAVTAGMVGVNVPIPVPMAFHSFGGWKRSNFGDMAMHGMEGVRFYTRLKTVTTRWPRSADLAAPAFTMPVSG